MLLVNIKVIQYVTLVLVLLFAILLNKFNSKVIDITEREKCPACFGDSLCQHIEDDRIKFEYSNFYSFINNLIGVKNVFYGEYESTKIIMKKLAHRSELDAFDEMVCNEAELFELCFKKSNVKETNTNFYNLIISELGNPDMTDLNNKMRLCPSVKKMKELFKNIISQNSAKNDYQILWTSTIINPEPIILQILSAYDDWPTPKYFGACGRVVIEENVGLPLSAFSKEPWIKRAKIASSLLDAAYKFTFKSFNFAFYLTDISEDNIAVNKDDEAIFIDLENVIIVDKYPSEKTIRVIETWNKTYVNEIDSECQDCLVFSPTDICNHKISDHNYYAICQNILVQSLEREGNVRGFLHNPPKDILKKYPELMFLIEQCLKPDKFDSRIDVGTQLKKLLDVIIDYSK